MTPHFDTYHRNKNTDHGCQNTVKGYKMTFGNPFLTNLIRVALMPESWVPNVPLYTNPKHTFPVENPL